MDIEKNFILNKKIIAIIRGLSAEQCLKTANALNKGGISLVEITFDQKSSDNYKSTLDAISKISENCSDKILVGAGTVMSVNQLELAAKHGARYIVSPNSDRMIIEKTKELGLISIPGAFSPTEIAEAYNWGADFVKLFPVNFLGAEYVKTICAPLSHIPIMAVGSVNSSNIKGYLKAGCIGAGVGSCVILKDKIIAGDYESVTYAAESLCRAAD